LGGKNREIHLLESPTFEKYITQYPIDGVNVVVKPKYENGKVYISDTLNYRKKRTLEFDDILHYQKIIVALYETDRIIKEIDKIQIA
jgi:hypothetical protein